MACSWACLMFVWINHYFWCVEYFVWLVGLENTSVVGEIRARTGNLAQASRTRLRESDGGSPRPSARVVAQVSGPNFLSERLPRSGKVSSPKRAGAFVSVRVIELSSRRRGTRLSESPSRLSETPWPERRA